MISPSSALTRLVAGLALAVTGVALRPATARTQQVEEAAPSLAITPVTVIDVREGEVLSDRTVVIEGDRITAVGSADAVEIPADARVVDGTDNYLIPGLWDMHAHTSSDWISRQVLLPLFVANGVTGIRNMSADCFETGEPNCGKPPIFATIEDVQEWRRRIAAGRLIGPRIVAGSYYVNSPPPGESSTPQYPRTAEHGRAHARLLHERGVDFIKIYDLLSREAYFALADEANRLGLPFAGHVPLAVRASEASEAGQRSIEHCCANSVLEQCSAREDELRDQVLAEFRSEEPEVLPFMLKMVESYDAEKCAELFATFVENGTWFTPTLMISRLPSEVDTGWRDDPRERFLPQEEREYFAEMEEFYELLVGDETAREPYSRWARRVTETMHRAGVRILAGTDAGYPGIYWGSALHEELELLITAGLTEADALRAATLEPARYLEATDSLGTVEEGKLADLVLLDANPLDDISHTREIRAVVADGRYLDREALDEILEQAEQAASRPQGTSKDSLSREEDSPSGKPRGDTVHVAPPTGKNENDRARVQEAFDRVQPGNTILFAPGTYVLGEGARLTVPEVTVLGHPDGTVLRGCEPERFDLPEGAGMEDVGAIAMGCTGFVVLADGQTIRGLTFDHTWHGIHVSRPLWLRSRPGEGPPEPGFGGHRIVGNVFRHVPNAIRVVGPTEEVTVIRENEVVNAYHAFQSNGAPVHIIDNRITVPEPQSVPAAHYPESGVILSPGPSPHGCEGSRVVGNVVEGTVNGIQVLAGTRRCHDHKIRDNAVEVRQVPLPPDYPRHLLDLYFGEDARGTAVAGTPIRLDGEVTRSANPAATDAITDVLIQDNRVLGGEGLGIQLARASDNRIVGNHVSGIRRRTPFPGLTWGEDPERWREANGSGIWLSPESDGNEIVDNTFEDVAGAAVFLEGDDNRVELRSAGDSVRDLGTGNEVRATDAAGSGTRSYWRPLASPDRATAWLSRSPDGTLFAGTRAGLFASEDLGRSWHLRGSAHRNIRPPLVTPEGALLAGSYRQGILRSTDGGRTWKAVGFERNIYTGSLVQDREGRFYAVAHGAVDDGPTGVFRSDDDGRTWTAVGLGDEEVYDLSVPRPGLLFAGTREGLFRSADGGATWSPAGELPSGAPVSEVVAYGGDLFASMGAPLWRIPGGGVARSGNGGDSWEPTEGLPEGAAVQDLEVHGGTLFAAVGDLRRDEGRGLYRLDTDGRWRPSGLGDVRLLSLLSTPDGLFAGARELGAFWSKDGRSWTRRSEGLRNWAVPSLAVGADGTLFGVTARDLFRSADRGRTWRSTPRPEDSAVPTPFSMIVSPEGRLLLAGDGGILVSEDGGASWERRMIPGEEGDVFALSTGPGGELFAVVRREAAYVSPDEGRSWRRLELPGAPVQTLFSSPTGARFATTAGGFHRRSGDGPWEEVSGEHVWALTTCGEALVAGTFARGLLRSTDDGRTWSPVTEELRARSQQRGYMSFTALACLPGGGVLAGTFWDGVFYSPDAGRTWRDATAGLPAESVQDFAVGPRGDVYVSTPAGVFVNVAVPDE